MSPKTDDLVGLICLGASAGGLRSLEAIVSQLSPDLPWPVLIAQHMQTDRVSQLPEILGRVAQMPVREVVAGETPKAGTIYMCPGSHEMGITLGGQITLRSPTPGRPQRVDHLFATASYARPGRTIAVILSGTGTDGAVGSLVVKLNGGSVITESDETAQHGGMPAAAVRAGGVDATLAAGEIASVLYAMAQRDLEESTAATRSLIMEIARDITKENGADFAHYREGTIRRQAEKRRIILGLRSLADYRDLIAHDKAEKEALARSILIPVTEFFRDAAAWRALEEEVIPLLAQRARDGHPVRVWCAGCATGEEAYSVAMLLAETVTDRQRIQILGTDLDPTVITAAAQGVYDMARMRGVDELRRDRFFKPAQNGYQIDKDLRSMVDFRVHDATRDEAPGKFDLVICRNLLIYFDETLQARTLRTFRDALVGPRILFLGRSETIQGDPSDFIVLLRPMRIFCAAGDEEVAKTHESVDTLSAPTRLASRSPSSDVEVEEPDAIVLIVDEAERITSANERARTFIEGEIIGTRLVDLFPRWQGSPVLDALRTSASTGRSLKVRGAPSPEGPMDVTLERALGPVPGTLLIATFVLPRAQASADRDALEARADLAATNDELQTVNEELAATNEELQATNEELASLNEEFQATNQTLASTNVELGEVALTARKATDLVSEFLQVWRDAIVACDGEQRVTEFNRRAAELFGLDHTVIGRPIELLGLAAEPSEVLEWLESARTKPLRKTVKHVRGDHELSVTYVKDPAGSLLGWVLSWARLPPA